MYDRNYCSQKACLATDVQGTAAGSSKFITLVWDCLDIAVCYELLYIKGNMCLYKDGSVAVYKCIRVNVQSTILLHDFSGRRSSSSDCASIIYVVIYRRSRLYVSVFIVSFILYI